MKNIVLIRIDDRLIHGQVVTQWIKDTNGNRILIVDDTHIKSAVKAHPAVDNHNFSVVTVIHKNIEYRNQRIEGSDFNSL